MNTHIVGVKGEDIATEYLTKHKYKVLQRNYNCQFGEIDIIAQQGKYIVFIEVKSRKDDSFGLPREAVDIHKQQTIIACAKLWLAQKRLYGKCVRFDVVEVLDGKVNLIKDAFRA